MRITVGKKELWASEKIKARDWLLIIGLSLAPMTGLRIWKIGPGEVLCLLWGLKFLISSKYQKNDISLFFAWFIPALGLGSLAGYIIAPSELRIGDMLTWIYLGIIAISIISGLRNNTLEYNEGLLFFFASVAMFWYLFLFIYGKYVNKSIFGVSLWYSSRRFSGGATNPHQVAVMLCALCFVFIRKILLKQKVLVSAFGIAACINLVVSTESSTSILAIALGLLIGAYFYVAYNAGRNRNTIMILMTIAILLVVVIKYDTLLNLFLKWVEKDDNGLGRFEIFASFPSSFSKSPLIGLGPGVHGRNGLIEFHNTYLEVLAATGLFGGLIFLVFSIRIFKKTIAADWKLFIIIVALYAYGLAGFGMRRLVFWGTIAFVVTLAEQINESSIQSIQSNNSNLIDN